MRKYFRKYVYQNQNKQKCLRDLDALFTTASNSPGNSEELTQMEYLDEVTQAWKVGHIDLLSSFW